MSKQPNRQKCQPKVYSESDFRQALRSAMMGLEKHHMELCVGSFALAMRRKLGLNAEQIADVLVATNEYSVNALCFQDVRKELLDETGLDIGEYADTI
jgi:hypothetical protein